MSTAELNAALGEWCRWIYTQAELAHRTTPERVTPEGQPPTWLDFCGTHERRLIEAAIAAGRFRIR